ncbi:ATP phosphoribosyltransferase regulatory subunit [Prochlorococcus sp. MIT 1300]|uniref:ATP phosphoribosyltransferase regulatory subunit n=1 Tax=Prochlorococcus sp. MIT 1300 TaxID=3096218 RepID=UPI002A7529E9|nr:ATP phosphoribosyltransferase regulatory subunit [Prochlorococcus sp. MIT 1300]
MALQPAAGAIDLNPQQVELNHQLIKRLSEVYKLWGYEEVSPPRVERLDTLKAGGAISSEDIVRLVSSDPLGLRPEMTASIARAACTRLAEKPRPLRLWASGTVFENRPSEEGGVSIQENLKSGVELFGVKEIAAEMELLSLLLASLKTLDLKKVHNTKVLIGHTGLMELILCSVSDEYKSQVKKALINFNRLALENIEIEKEIKDSLIEILGCRGSSNKVVDKLTSFFGNHIVIEELKRLITLIQPTANAQNVDIQVDPTFQPHFELYTGIVFQIVCQGKSSPVIIARGGRYDELVRICGAKREFSAGVGFSFAIDEIREIITDTNNNVTKSPQTTLVAYHKDISLEVALERQAVLHSKGLQAVVDISSSLNKEEAEERMAVRGYKQLEWIDK